MSAPIELIVDHRAMLRRRGRDWAARPTL